MGRDIHIHIAKYNEETNLFHELCLYRQGEEYHYNEEGEKIIDNPDFKKVSVYSGRNYEMFNGMKEGDDEDGFGFFPMFKIRFASLEEGFRKEIEEKTKILGYYDFFEISLAGMRAYVLEHPEIVDYDSKNWKDEHYYSSFEEKPHKVNPIKTLYEDILNYIKFADEWDFSLTPFSEYKILIYFDC